MVKYSIVSSTREKEKERKLCDGDCVVTKKKREQIATQWEMERVQNVNKLIRPVGEKKINKKIQ